MGQLYKFPTVPVLRAWDRGTKQKWDRKGKDNEKYEY